MRIDISQDRLSPLNITDPLVRVELYREIRNAQANQQAGWSSYEIQPADSLMPELIAYKFYKLDTLKWVIMVAAGLDNPRERLTEGKTLYLPSTAWIRERIKHYQSVEQIGK